MEEARYNLGCGDDVRDGYVNVDVRESGDVVTGDIREPYELIHRFGHPKEVVMQDVLEHLPWREADDVLREWCQHLLPGGEIYVQVPNMARFARNLLNDQCPLDKVRSDIFGGQDYPENTHRTFFTIERITQIMRSEHLDISEAREQRNLHVCGIKQEQEQDN